MSQDNPVPLPPNYERIDKETHRMFGEYRYKRLVKRFERCDTTMTVDHFRCLYYGAWLRRRNNVTDVKVDVYHALYVLDSSFYGSSSVMANRDWWRLQMLLTAVWSSGNGSAEYPFYVTSPDDMIFIVDDMGLSPSGDFMDIRFYKKGIIEVQTVEGVTLYFVIGAPQP